MERLLVAGLVARWIVFAGAEAADKAFILSWLRSTGPYARSIRAAQALYSAVRVILSKASFVSRFVDDST